MLSLPVTASISFFAKANECAEQVDTTCQNELLQSIFQLDSDSTLFFSLLEVGDIFLKKGKTVSGIYFLEKAAIFAKKAGNYSYSAKAAEALGMNYRNQGNTDKAEKYLRENLLWSEKSGDKSLIGLAKSNLGMVVGWKGEIDQAMKLFHEAIFLFEEINDEENLGRPYQYMGVLYGMEHDEKKSIDAFRKSAALYQKVNNEIMASWAEGNLANTYLQINQPDSAIRYLKKVIPVFEKKDDLRAIINSKTQLGRAYEILGDLDAALMLVLEVTKMAEEANLINQLAYNHRLLSKIYTKMNQHQKSIQSAKAALAIHEKMGANHEYHLAVEDLSEAYGAAGDYTNAYRYAEESRRISDSLFTEEKKLEMADAEAKFEAEKKAKEIAIVEAEKELEKMRRSRFQLLALLIGLAAFAGIGFLFFKNKKDKQLLENQRDIEVANRKNTELENVLLQKDLSQKKRELVSNTLLISKKNEFLKDLLERIDKGEDDPRKLKRLVKSELQSEEDWDDFISAFRDSHQSFMEGLFKIENNLSKTEVRMACLLKMNLQTKEIANLLNISSEGVRKAKYRLKQKLRIETTIDIQGFLMALN